VLAWADVLTAAGHGMITRVVAGCVVHACAPLALPPDTTNPCFVAGTDPLQVDSFPCISWYSLHRFVLQWRLSE
jgi:hypothetical protein